jgi:hypothetical protein
MTVARGAQIRAGLAVHVSAGKAAAVLLLLPLLLAVFPVPWASPAEPEDEVKAVAVLNFLRYSTWPAPAAGMMTVGVLGRRGFLETLRATLENRPVNGRNVRVTEVKSAADAPACQLVYFATERRSEIGPVLAGAVAARALTVGECDRFLDYGGSVNLFVVDGHISFEASLEAIGRTGITVSSNLLRVGQVRDLGRHGAPK